MEELEVFQDMILKWLIKTKNWMAGIIDSWLWNFKVFPLLLLLFIMLAYRDAMFAHKKTYVYTRYIDHPLPSFPYIDIWPQEVNILFLIHRLH